MSAGAIFYVANVEQGGDFNFIPISMFDQPALFTDRAKADAFCMFANGTGSRHEVREFQNSVMPQWLPIDTAPKDGSEVIVGVEIASVWITRGAFYDDGGCFDVVGAERLEDQVGWWSYENSVSQERLDGIYEPTHWIPMPAPPIK